MNSWTQCNTTFTFGAVEQWPGMMGPARCFVPRSVDLCSPRRITATRAGRKRNGGSEASKTPKRTPRPVAGAATCSLRFWQRRTAIPPSSRFGTDFNRHPPDERLFGARLTPGTGIGKPEPRRERPNVPEAGSIGTLRAGNSNLVLAKTHLSLGFRWNSCRRPVHAGAGSGGGRSSAISRRISANSILGTATSAIWKAT